MDQREGAQHMKPIYFKGCVVSAAAQTRAHKDTHKHICTQHKVESGCVCIGGISISNPLAAQQRREGMANL